MNKNKIILMVIILILILIGAFFGFTKLRKQTANDLEGSLQKTANNTVEEKVQPTTSADNTNPGLKSIKGSMFDLIKLGIPQKCSFTSQTDKTGTMGTTYVSGKRVRSDFTVTTEDNQTIKSHMISDGDWAYIWSDLTGQGMKMKIDQAEIEKAQQEATTNENLQNLQKNFDYKCSAWIPDNATFDTPSNIEFTDFTDTINSFKQDNNGAVTPTKAPVNMCSTCNLIQDAEAKASCRANFKCN